jgi:hypothetical protein
MEIEDDCQRKDKYEQSEGNGLREGDSHKQTAKKETGMMN